MIVSVIGSIVVLHVCWPSTQSDDAALERKVGSWSGHKVGQVINIAVVDARKVSIMSK
jgi:hypothetical protein